MFSAVDWFIIGVLGISALISIRRGFIQEALSLAIWITAVVVAVFFGGQLAVLLEPYIENWPLRLITSCGGLFIGTLLVGGVVNFAMGEFVKMTGLTGTDRFLGIFFGLGRGAIIVLVMVAGLHYIVPVEEERWYRESLLVPELVKLIEQLGPALWERGGRLLDSQAVPGG